MPHAMLDHKTPVTRRQRLEQIEDELYTQISSAASKGDKDLVRQLRKNRKFVKGLLNAERK